MKPYVTCYVFKTGQQWEAICVDLDISVSGKTLDGARKLLDHAVMTYVEDALKEDPETQRQLLNRRAPLSVRMGLKASYLWRTITRRANRKNGEYATFNVPCHA